MQITNLTLAYQLAELREVVEGSFVNNVQELGKGFLKFRLHTREGSRNLIFNPDIIYFTRFKLTAKHSLHGFAAFLKKQLYNKKIISLAQHGFDRIAVMEFAGHWLVFELFAESNLVLCDKEWVILNALKKQTWKTRTIAKGEKYLFPSSKGLNPAGLSVKELKDVLLRQENELVKALIRELNIAPVLAEEVCFEAGIDKKRNVKELKEKDFEKVNEKLNEFYRLIDLVRLKPVLLKEKDSETILPFALNSKKELVGEEFLSLNEFFDEVYSKELIEAPDKKTVGKHEEKIAALEHSLREQSEAKKKFEKQVTDNQRKAELIYSHFQELNGIVEAVKRGQEKKVSEKEIAEKLKEKTDLLKEVNLKEKKIVVELG